MATVYLALGSNLGNREDNLTIAINHLLENNIKVRKLSTIIETDPVDGPVQGKYLNAVLEAETTLPAEELLSLLQSTEKKMGRVRAVRNAPRPIDIDILLYAKEVINTSSLTIPHPRMFERDFVLRPLREIAPQVVEELLDANH